MIFYFAHKVSVGWMVLGYESETFAGARQQAVSAYPSSLQIRGVGKDTGYPRPLSDEAVLLAEALFNVHIK